MNEKPEKNILYTLLSRKKKKKCLKQDEAGKIGVHTTILKIVDGDTEVLKRAGVIGRGNRGCQCQEGNEKIGSSHVCFVIRPLNEMISK